MTNLSFIVLPIVIASLLLIIATTTDKRFEQVGIGLAIIALLSVGIGGITLSGTAYKAVGIGGLVLTAGGLVYVLYHRSKHRKSLINSVE